MHWFCKIGLHKWKRWDGFTTSPHGWVNGWFKAKTCDRCGKHERHEELSLRQ